LSPIPYVRLQAIVLGAAVSSAGVFHDGLIPVVCASVALVWLIYLRGRYLRDIEGPDACLPPHRSALDRVVEKDGFVALVGGLVLCIVFWVHPLSVAHWLVVVGVASGSFAIGWTVVYASSLVDWYVILPRGSGQLGHRPCRAAEEEEEFSFPNTWREVTRWWYIHRVAAATAFRFGLSGAITTAAVAATGVPRLGQAIAWVIGLIFGAYALITALRGFKEALQVRQAGHPKGYVGQTVTVERRPGRRSRLKPWRRLPALKIEGRQYVVDVSLESTQLAAVLEREDATLPSPIRFERDVDSVALSDLDAVRQAHPKFAGCRDRCSGINWYCTENPRCYRPK
jgi:hypothetical protein